MQYVSRDSLTLIFGYLSQFRDWVSLRHSFRAALLLSSSLPGPFPRAIRLFSTKQPDPEDIIASTEVSWHLARRFLRREMSNIRYHTRKRVANIATRALCLAAHSLNGHFGTFCSILHLLVNNASRRDLQSIVDRINWKGVLTSIGSDSEMLSELHTFQLRCEMLKGVHKKLLIAVTGRTALGMQRFYFDSSDLSEG